MVVGRRILRGGTSSELLRSDPYVFQIHRKNDARRAEQELITAGFELPVRQRCDWHAGQSRSCWFVSLRRDATPVFGFAVPLSASRALPGFRIARVHRLGSTSDAKGDAMVARGLAIIALRFRRILRIEVDVFSRGLDARQSVVTALRKAGFHESHNWIGYRNTLVLDLEPGANAVFRSLHKTARANIRAIGRAPLAVRTITHPSMSRRLDSLLAETMARTNGYSRHEDWPSIIAFCNRNPTHARLVGVFDSRLEGPEALLGFSLGLRHRDHVEYAIAATTRHYDLKVSLGYGALWDLMEWAIEIGCSWFDLGGVTTGDERDPIKGISSFKRYFTRREEAVGEGWVFESRRISAISARLASRAASLLRKPPLNTAS